MLSLNVGQLNTTKGHCKILWKFATYEVCRCQETLYYEVSEIIFKTDIGWPSLVAGQAATGLYFNTFKSKVECLVHCWVYGLKLKIYLKATARSNAKYKVAK